ncbi:MAG: septum site-determining protein MinC [Chloroflexi bacterium]|nr:MAG: septum site-determining protein MinC [Chloroflexota bacterium]
MKQMPIVLKGTPQGLLLKPQAQSWDVILNALEYALQDAAAFFRGGRVILELEDHTFTEANLTALRALLERHEMELWAVLGVDEATQHLVREHGIRTRLPGTATPAAETESPETIFARRTLRSGQRLNTPGDVTLLGDVNPGAEVLAGGNIVIWGRARGVLHAGAWGDETAVVCALDLNPAQLRIAGIISRAPEQRRRRPQPEVARIEDGVIIARPWTAKG